MLSRRSREYVGGQPSNISPEPCLMVQMGNISESFLFEDRNGESRKDRLVFQRGSWLSGLSTPRPGGLTEPQAIQRTKPQSLSYGLWDSPIALLAWIREKMETWSDSYPWTDREIVTWVMIYWASQVTGGLRIYKYGHLQDITSGYVGVPFGVIVFPKELFVAPKGIRIPPSVLGSSVDWARQCGNLKFYRVHENGGFQIFAGFKSNL
jgi:hypothetical protein